jgi:hypothetical protein
VSEDRSVVRNLLRDLREVLELTLAILGDDEAATEVLGSKVDGSGLAEASGALATLEQFVEGEGRLEDAAAAAERIVEVSTMLRLTAQATQGQTPADLAGELAGVLLDAVALAYLSRRLRTAVAAARVLRFLDDQIHWDRIGAFFGDAGGYVNDQFGPLETEDDARRRSLLLGLLGIGAVVLEALTERAFDVAGGQASVEVLHGFEPDPASTTPAADAISDRMLSLAFRYERGGVDSTVLLTTAFVPRIVDDNDRRPQGGPGLWVSLSGETEGELPLGGGWHLVVEGAVEDGVDGFLAFEGATHDSFVDVGGAIGGEIALRLERRDEPAAGTPAEPWDLGGLLELKEAAFALRLADRGPFALARLRDAALVLEPPEGQPWRRLFPSGLRSEFDVGVGVDRDGKIFFEGGAGLRVLLPISFRTRFLSVRHVLVELAPPPEGARELVLEVGIGFTVQLGKLTLTVDRLGKRMKLDMSEPDSEEETPDRFQVEWAYPDSVGLAVDADWVKGGGFLALDEERGRYAGMLDLTFRKWSLTAFGLLTEQDGGESSFIGVLTFDLPKPIPLWFGLRLEEVGGLVARNHRLDVPALQAGLRSGVANTLLFPDDPVAAGPQILTTLGNVFPAAPGTDLVGLLLKLTWGTRRLGTLSVAIVIERPAPIRLLVLGEVEVTCPSGEKQVLVLRAEFAGVLDTAGQSFEFDAALSHSRVAGFVLTGDLAVRVRRGEDDSLFLVAAGGFHPRFTVPANANLPPQRRMTVALSAGENPRARLELYAAFTGGTVQAGGKLDVRASAGGFSAEALLSLDVLIQLEPNFGFDAEIEARAAIRHDGSAIAGVGLRLRVTGPSPWKIDGKATFDLFLFSVSIPIRKTFGPQVSVVVQEVDAGAMLRGALEDPSSWDVGSPAGPGALVTLASRPTADDVIPAHPLGRLAVRQEVLPLGIDLTRVGGARTAPDRFDVTVVTVAGAGVDAPEPLRSQFAPAQFVELTDDEKLERPEFEALVSGFEVGPAAATHGPALTADLGYEEIVIGPDGPIEDPRPGRPALGAILLHAAALGAAATSRLRDEEVPGVLRATSPVVELRTPAPVVADSATLEVAGVPDAGASFTEAAQAAARHAAADASGLVVVAPHEVGPGG